MTETKYLYSNLTNSIVTVKSSKLLETIIKFRPREEHKLTLSEVMLYKEGLDRLVSVRILSCQAINEDSVVTSDKVASTNVSTESTNKTNVAKATRTARSRGDRAKVDTEITVEAPASESQVPIEPLITAINEAINETSANQKSDTDKEVKEDKDNVVTTETTNTVNDETQKNTDITNEIDATNVEPSVDDKKVSKKKNEKLSSPEENEVQTNEEQQVTQVTNTKKRRGRKPKSDKV